MYTKYICVYSDGCPVTIDYSSRGYPYRQLDNNKEFDYFRATFMTKLGAVKYAEHFQTATYGGPLSVRKVTITIGDM